MRHARTRLSIAAALVLSLASIPACAALPLRARQGEKPLTIERLYSEPSLSGSLATGITWLPDGSAYVFIEKEEVPATSEQAGAEMAETDKEKSAPKPRSSLVRVDAATGERSTFVSADAYEKAFAEATIGERRPSGRPGFGGFQILPDGKRLVVPQSGDLYLYDVGSATQRRLTASKSDEKGAAVAPDGSRIAFVRDANLYTLDLASGLETQLTADGTDDHTNGLSDWVYDEELSVTTGFWWSTDSKRIAFLKFDETPVSQIPIVDFLPYRKAVEWERYPKAGDPNPIVKLAVVSLSDGKIVPIDTPGSADGYIARVTWTPDGAALLVQVLNRKQNRLTVLKADPQTGASTPLFEETSTAWIDVHGDLRVLRDGRVLWQSACDGFAHLYLSEADGKTSRPLTRGTWNVERVEGLDEGGGWVYFTGAEKSPLETHLYRVHLDGSSLERVTREDGNHSITMPESATAFLDTHSDVSRPSRRSLRKADGSLVKVIEENPCEELQTFRLGSSEFFAIKTEDGVALQAQWIKPPDFDAIRRYPVLVYVYGGPLSQIVRNAWGGTRYLWHHLLAQRGILVLLIDNRAGAPHGLKVASTIYGRLGEVELRDQLEAVKYLRTLPYVDGARIGIWGWSYGGYMAAYSILNAPDAFHAAVAVAPVTDWRDYDTIYTERYMNLPDENVEGYKKSAPVNAAKNLKGKLLLVHGTADDNVHLQNSVQLINALIREGKQFRFMTYPGGRHGIGGLDSQKHLFTMITDFLVESLEARPAGEG